MKGNNPVFSNSGDKVKSVSSHSTNPGTTRQNRPYNNKKGLKLLKKVKTEEAKNFIKQHYRSGGKEGDGSTAAAIKMELKEGVKVGGKSHITKGKEGIKTIDNILKKNPKHVDRKFLLSEKKKLEKALNTKPKKGGKKKWIARNSTHYY